MKYPTHHSGILLGVFLIPAMTPCRCMHEFQNLYARPGDSRTFDQTKIAALIAHVPFDLSP